MALGPKDKIGPRTQIARLFVGRASTFLALVARSDLVSFNMLGFGSIWSQENYKLRSFGFSGPQTASSRRASKNKKPPQAGAFDSSPLIEARTTSGSASARAQAKQANPSKPKPTQHNHNRWPNTRRLTITTRPSLESRLMRPSV